MIKTFATAKQLPKLSVIGKFEEYCHNTAKLPH